MLAIRFGTSGWSYQEWVGRFYPNNKVAKLPYYSRVFDSVEVDSSFYRPPSKSMASGWATATAESFRFSLILPKMITPGSGHSGAKSTTEAFMKSITPIEKAGKLGCLLIQLPANFTFSEKDELEAFFSLLPEKVHFAVEFRHESWDRGETWRMLEKYNIANTITDSPAGVFSKPIITSATHAYVRWHGRGKSAWHEYRYSEDELATGHQTLVEIESRVHTVYAYFNNHSKTNAPANLLTLIRMRGELTENQARALRRCERRQKKDLQAATRLDDYL